MSFLINKQVLAELNLCRNDPKRYSSKLTNTLQYYKGKLYEKPGKPRIETREGVVNVEACINYLKTIRPVQPLKWSNSLYLAAQAHANDIGPLGLVDHNSSDGKEPADRISLYCKWSGAIGENIAYGCTDAEEIVTSLLVDDGVLARGQRLNIMKRDHNYVGIAIGSHKEYEYLCVIVFAEEVKDDDEAGADGNEKIEIKKNKKTNQLRKMKTLDGFEFFDVRNYEKPGLSHNKILEFKEIFDFLDNESEGVIDPAEIRTIIEGGENEISDMSAFQKLADIDFEGKKYGFDEFLELMTEKSSVSLTLSKSDIQQSRFDQQSLNLPPTKSSKNKEKFSYNPENAILNEDEIIEIKEYFDAIDSNSSGFIDADALRSLIEVKELEGSNSDIFQLLNEFDPEEMAGLGFTDLLGKISDKKNSLCPSRFLSPKSSISLAKSSVSLSKTEEPKKQVRKAIKKTSFSKSYFDPKRYEREDLPLETIIELKEAFDMFDTKRSGAINPHDLKHAMEHQGFQTKSPTIFHMICRLPDEGIDDVNFEEFLNMVTCEDLDNSSAVEFRRVFNIFDVEQKGYIELRNLRKIARELGESLNEKELLELFSKSDLDGDGKVSFQDFYNVMNLQTYF